MAATTWMRKTTRALVLLALLAAASAAVAQQAIAIGPYVQDVSTDNATICWATLSGQVTVAPLQGDAVALHEYQHHEVRIRDLEPGTTYTYDVLGDGSDAGRGMFTTVPEGEYAFSFAVVADTQNRDNAWHRPIVERIIAARPDLVLNVGDLVSDGRDILDWDRFFEINADLMRFAPYYAVLGNHDRHSALYFDFFALPGNERYYSFDRGAAHFVVVDSPGPYLPENNQTLTPGDRARYAQQCEAYWQRQMEWLREDLEGHQKAKYIFVFFHYPVYSVLASRVESANRLRERFGSVFQDYGVSAVFHGHDHHYHRAAAGGVQFVTGGVAGGNARPTDAAPLPESVKYASAVTYMLAEVGPERTTVRVIDTAGATVDEFELLPRAAGAAAEKPSEK